jgi:hypothetical protein
MQIGGQTRKQKGYEFGCSLRLISKVRNTLSSLRVCLRVVAAGVAAFVVAVGVAARVWQVLFFIDQSSPPFAGFQTVKKKKKKDLCV